MNRTHTTTRAPRMITRVNRALRAAGIRVKLYANSTHGYYYFVRDDGGWRDVPSLYVYRLDHMTADETLAHVNASLRDGGLPELRAL